jgi:hypothetical protein
MIVGHGRGVALGGAPWFDTSPRTGAMERAKVVAYLHGLADVAEREEAVNFEPRGADEYRAAARAIEAGDHWK